MIPGTNPQAVLHKCNHCGCYCRMYRKIFTEEEVGLEKCPACGHPLIFHSVCNPDAASDPFVTENHVRSSIHSSARERPAFGLVGPTHQSVPRGDIFGHNPSGSRDTLGQNPRGGRLTDSLFPGSPLEGLNTLRETTGRSARKRMIGPFGSGLSGRQVSVSPNPNLKGTCLQGIKFTVACNRKPTGNKVPSSTRNQVETDVMTIMDLIKVVDFQEDDPTQVDRDIRNAFPCLRGLLWKVQCRYNNTKKDDLADCVLPRNNPWSREAFVSNSEKPKQSASSGFRHRRLYIAPKNGYIPLSRAARQEYPDLEPLSSSDEEDMLDPSATRGPKRRQRSSGENSPQPEQQAVPPGQNNWNDEYDEDIVLINEIGPSRVSQPALRSHTTVNRSAAPPILLAPVVYPPLPVRSIPGEPTDRHADEIHQMIIALVKTCCSDPLAAVSLADPMCLRLGTELKDFVEYFKGNLRTLSGINRIPDVQIDNAVDQGGPSREGYQRVSEQFRNYEGPEFGGRMFLGNNSCAIFTTVAPVTPEAKLMLECFGTFVLWGILHKLGYATWFSKSVLRSICDFPYDYNEIEEISPGVWKMVNEILHGPETVQLASVADFPAWNEVNSNFRVDAVRDQSREQTVSAILEMEFVDSRAASIASYLRGLNKGNFVQNVSELGPDFQKFEERLCKVVETVDEFFLQFNLTSQATWTENQRRVFELFKNVVRDYSAIQLQSLLRFFTGSPHIPVPVPLILVWIRNAGTPRIPHANTCFGRITFDEGFENDARLRAHLEHCLTTRGFQFV